MDNLAKQDEVYTEEQYYSLDLPVRTELIDWQIYYLASPSTRHQDILGMLYGEIIGYIKGHKGKCKVFPAPSDVKLRDGTIVQPDIYVTCSRDKIGTQYHSGAPDWVIEIVSPGSAAHDYDVKMWLYMQTGVKEYWIVDPQRESVAVHLFEKKQMETYTFAEEIPVSIYAGEAEPLKICIKDTEY